MRILIGNNAIAKRWSPAVFGPANGGSYGKNLIYYGNQLQEKG